MNTERPENDDSTGASGDVPEEAREEKGAVGSGQVEAGTGAEGEAGAEPATTVEAETEDEAETKAGAEDRDGAGTGVDAGAGTGEASAAEEAGAAAGAEATDITPDAEIAPEAREAPATPDADATPDAEKAPAAVDAENTSGIPDAAGLAASADESPAAPGTATEPDRTGADAGPDRAPANELDQARATAQPEHARASSEPDRARSAAEPDQAHAAGEHPTVSDGDEPGPADLGRDGGASEHSGRRRSPLIIASVAAAVLLVGGGGAYLAANASGGSGGRAESGASGGDGAPPALALDGYSETSPSGGGNGIAPGEPNPYGQTYKVDGELPDGPGSAPVYWAKGQVGKAEVASLAEALGVDGTPVAEGGVWKVGPAKAGEGPTLQVDRQAPGAWTFTRYTPGTDDCKGGAALCRKDPMAPAVDPVSVETAKKAAAPILKALGQDDAKVDASQVMGAQRVVNADPEVDGLPTYGWTTGLTVGAQGEVVGGSGQLDAPVKGATYPVLSAQKTLDLMKTAPGGDHRMGIGGCASAVPLKDRLEAPCGKSADAPATEPATITDAVFGLASHTARGQQTLVPSWLFEVRAPGSEDVYTMTYPAVDPKYLTSTLPSEPSAQPSPRPSSPGDEATGAPRDVKVDGYTAEGKELTVSFTGGVCADYRTTAKESGDKVTVTVTETPYKNKVCIMIAKVFHQTVQLDEPLGDRKVVGTQGKAVPLEKPGARLPETSAR
ncbi:hypothetical protein ACGFNV_21915 [Streptomyces sp. NPDC048751]|uniref:hypothetical protein n=1 Tax=Streptomyces sp. NPDC048751 TaxID=3365591 RepID=UPI00371E562A